MNTKTWTGARNQSRRVAVACVAASLLAVGCGTKSEPSELTAIPTMLNVADNAANIRIGRGFDSIQERARGDCLAEDVALEALPETLNGRNMEFSLDVVRSRSELMRRMGVSVGASLSLAIFGASAKFEESNYRRVASDSLSKRERS